MATNYDFFYNVPYPFGVVKNFLDLNEDGASCDSTEEDILTNKPHVFAVGA